MALTLRWGLPLLFAIFLALSLAKDTIGVVKSVKEQNTETQLFVESTTLTYLEWITFAAGTTLGAAIEMSINVSDQCLSSVASTLQSAYLVYYYLSNYLLTNSDDNVAYATSYLVKMMRAGYDLSYCSSYLSTIFSTAHPLEGFVKQSYGDL